MIPLLAMLACGASQEPLSPAEVLTRASLDLSGARPDEAALIEVTENPEALSALLDALLDSPTLEERLVLLYADHYRTRVESYRVGVPPPLLDDPLSFARSVGEEPLRVLAHIAVNDLPYTELVLADWTMADAHLAAQWPVDYPEGEGGWRRVSYTDARPPVGVLASNGLWWRYTSTRTNGNRGRANAVSRILLCEDYLERPLSVDLDGTTGDQASVDRAVQEDPACLSCHAALDPLAAFFFGFFTINTENAFEASSYLPQHERLWQDMLPGGPAYFGVPASGLSELGELVANDPVFIDCAVEQTLEVLLGRQATLADTEALTAHREVFLDGGLRLKPLLRSAIEDPRYQGQRAEADGGVPAKVVTPELLASQVEALTGYTWTRDDRALLATASEGYRELAGGADGEFVTQPVDAVGPTMLLVQARLAEAAAGAVVLSDAGLPAGERRLFTQTDPQLTPSEDDARAQLVTLRRRALSELHDPDSEVIDADYALLIELTEIEGDPLLGWQGVLTALLRSPQLLIY